MSVISLPQATLDELDKISRSFLWGSTSEKRKQHLIAWDRVCVPKQEGGVGIRKATEMNKALLGKVGWRLMQNRVSLWARLLRCKYKVGNTQQTTWATPKGGCSSTWRSICVGIREVVIPGQSWVLGNGRETRFWQDKWLANKPLLDIAVTEVPMNMREAKVCDMWAHGVGWLWDNIGQYLTEERRLQLRAVVVDNFTGSQDRLSWGETSDGCFTVTSAYSFLTRNMMQRPDMEKFWSRVWSVGIPERVKVFLWLVGNQAIMSNSERYRRHLSSSSVCEVCKGGEETIIHILRDCPAMAGVWRRLVPAGRLQQFFSKTLLEWMYDNLGGGSMLWQIQFSMAIWWGWKWRCGNVFGTNGKCRDRVKFLKDLAKEVTVANEKNHGSGGGRAREERLISWSPPKPGWTKLNTDGASHGNPGRATAGGVLRDETGAWLGGFSLNIGICSAPLAECWGVYYGLYIAWEKRVTRLEVEVDSEVVVDFLKTGIGETHPLSFLVRLCHGFISRDWTVRISHVYREANRLADGLANHAFSLSLGFHAFISAPNVVDLILLDDARGAAVPRRICV